MINVVQQNTCSFILDYCVHMNSMNRLEVVEVKSAFGITENVRTILPLTGALVMVLYKGHTIESLKSAPFNIGSKMAHNNWIKRSIITIRPYGQIEMYSNLGAHAFSGRHTAGAFTNQLQIPFSEPLLFILVNCYLS